MKKTLLLIGFFLMLFAGLNAQQLIQGTIKLGANPNEIEVWLKPNFTNSTEYLFQIGLPIAYPASASPAPTDVTVTLDAGFVSAFGSNYSVSKNPVAQNTGGTEKYINVVLVRSGVGASNPQSWTAGVEFKVLTVSFVPSTAPNAQVKLADYQNGGSDGQGNFYTQSGNNSYYVTSNSIGNFYASSGNSTVGGTASAGYAQTIVSIPHISCNAPSTPTVTNITATSADINWSAVSGAVGYEYAVTTSATPPVSGTATSSTSFSASGLTATTQYYAHVRTDCGSGTFSSWATAPFSTINPSCNAPTGLAVNNITTSAADVSWTAVSGVVGYEYAVTTSSTPPGSGTSTTATSVSATGLTTGTTYYLHVRSNCGSLFSSWASTPFNTLCAATTTPVASAITATGATISWTAVSGAIGYEYEISTSATPSSSGTSTTSTSFNATGLVPGTLYYAHVRTACSAGSFSSWMSVTFTTLCPATTTPTISGITPTSATVSWSSVSGASGYEYAVTTSSTPPSSGTSTTALSVLVSSLTQGTTYYAHVRTACSAGIFSSWSSTSFTTTIPPCLAPTGLAVTNISSSADVSWNAVSGASSYQYAVTTSSTPPTSGGTVTTATSFQATGLLGSTQYYAHVRTDCGAGGFSPWASKAFTTPCLTPVLSVEVNGTSAQIDWNNSGASSYEYALTTSLADPVGGTLTSDTTHTSSNLLAGTTYHFHLRAHCSGGGLSNWTSIVFHTAGMEVFPNPVSGMLRINLYGVSGDNGVLSVYDAAGKLVRRIAVNDPSLTVDMRTLAAGVYMLKYVEGSNRYMVKVVKR
jgi:hypothetical protein